MTDISGTPPPLLMILMDLITLAEKGDLEKWRREGFHSRPQEPVQGWSSAFCPSLTSTWGRRQEFTKQGLDLW